MTVGILVLFAVRVTVLPPGKLQVGGIFALPIGATEQVSVTVPAKEFTLVTVRVEVPVPPGAAMATAVAVELLGEEIEKVEVEVTVSVTAPETADDR
jgi:hypothetical protein